MSIDNREIAVLPSTGISPVESRQQENWKGTLYGMIDERVEANENPNNRDKYLVVAMIWSHWSIEQEDDKIRGGRWDKILRPLCEKLAAGNEPNDGQKIWIGKNLKILAEDLDYYLNPTNQMSGDPFFIKQSERVNWAAKVWGVELKRENWPVEPKPAQPVATVTEQIPAKPTESEGVEQAKREIGALKNLLSSLKRVGQYGSLQSGVADEYNKWVELMMRRKNMEPEEEVTELRSKVSNSFQDMGVNDPDGLIDLLKKEDEWLTEIYADYDLDEAVEVGNEVLRPVVEMLKKRKN